MPSQIDFAIAVGLFITFIVILFLYLTGYMSSYVGLVSTSELRTVAYNIYNSLFGGKGIPENWEEQNYTPVKVGLITDLYRVPIVVTETNGTERDTETINISLSFDPNCEKKAWNSTVRVYENGDEITSQLYNQTFCSENYLNNSDLVFNSSFSANQTKTFFIYFSGEKSIDKPNYSLPFNISSNFTIQIYPEEKLTTISITKLKALRNLTYEEVVSTLGTEYKLRIEISEE